MNQYFSTVKFVISTFKREKSGILYIGCDNRFSIDDVSLS